MEAEEDLRTVVNEIAKHKEVLQKTPAEIDKHEKEKVVKRISYKKKIKTYKY
jgi:hypothetical protein